MRLPFSFATLALVSTFGWLMLEVSAVHVKVQNGARGKLSMDISTGLFQKFSKFTKKTTVVGASNTKIEHLDSNEDAYDLSFISLETMTDIVAFYNRHEQLLEQTPENKVEALIWAGDRLGYTALYDVCILLCIYDINKIVRETPNRQKATLLLRKKYLSQLTREYRQ